MHDHFRPEVVDPEVIILAVAQVTDQSDGLLLRLFLAQFAAELQRMLMFEDALYAFHHMLGLQHFAGIKIVITLAQQQHAHGQQHGDGNQNNQPQAATDG